MVRPDRPADGDGRLRPLLWLGTAPPEPAGDGRDQLREFRLGIVLFET
jgi:hypothetical protein